MKQPEAVDAMTWSFFDGAVAGLLLAIPLIGCAPKPKSTAPPIYPPHDFQEAGEEMLARQDRDRWLSARKAPAVVYFAFDSARLTQEAAEALDGLPGSCACEGHASEEGETTYNLALGAARARSVSAYLATARGTPLGPVISYGEERPATYDPALVHLNRRVEVRCP